MKVQRVYVDTSVIGGCHDVEFAPWSNGLMKDFRLGTLRPVVSDIVEAEVARAPDIVRATYRQLLELGPERAVVTEEAETLANTYLRKGALSPNYFDDALHIALATIAEVDVLVSWNFRHIVHLEKIRRFNAANLEKGYKPITIYSPREVTSYGEPEDDE
jgi:predicted nucleic acid-binding protein